jgi:hypothetical protein
MLNGFVKVEDYASSWSATESILELHPDVQGLWTEATPGNDLDKFIKVGYKLVHMEPSPIGELMVMMTREHFNYLKGKKNG